MIILYFLVNLFAIAVSRVPKPFNFFYFYCYVHIDKFTVVVIVVKFNDRCSSTASLSLLVDLMEPRHKRSAKDAGNLISAFE